MNKIPIREYTNLTNIIPIHEYFSKYSWISYYAPRPAEQSEAGRGAFYFSAYSDLYQTTTGWAV